MASDFSALLTCIRESERKALVDGNRHKERRCVLLFGPHGARVKLKGDRLSVRRAYAGEKGGDVLVFQDDQAPELTVVLLEMKDERASQMSEAVEELQALAVHADQVIANCEGDLARGHTRITLWPVLLYAGGLAKDPKARALRVELRGQKVRVHPHGGKSARLEDVLDDMRSAAAGGSAR